METMLTHETARGVYRHVWDRLLKAERVLLVSPCKPDGDSVGSICGLFHALRSMQRHEVVMYCADPMPAQFDRIPGVHDIRIGSESLHRETFDVIVVVDSGDLAFAGIVDDLPKWRRHGSTLIVIDHHATNTFYGDVNCVVRSASTTEAITQLLTENGVPMTPSIASALFYGLVYDTDNFSNPATSASACATAAMLVVAGAQSWPVFRALYQNKTIGAMKLWGRAFSCIRIHPTWGIATCVLTTEDFATLGEDASHAEGLSNFLQTVLPVKAVLVLKDRGTGMVRGSLRTVRDDVDLGKLAEALGGGGHQKASGFGVRGRLVKRGDRWNVV
ncbi:MAG: DHH family phosphoesterase [Candidatus Uhrbacteria bacterium]